MRIKTALPVLLSLLIFSCGPKWSKLENDNFTLIVNHGGKTLGYHPESGLKLLTVDRMAFKDLNRNDQLDPYEDWRLSAQERAVDLASKMNKEQIAGLMLYSAHQSIPARSQGYFAGTYNGAPYEDGKTDAASLTDQ